MRGYRDSTCFRLVDTLITVPNPAILFPMELLATYLPYIQIALSALLMVTILLQRTGASMGGAFGADNFSSGFHTRRGIERTLFNATIVIGILFALSAVLSLFIK